MRPHQLQGTALRYFLEVAQGGSIAHASAHLHVAASALSRRIADLEAQLGTPLFERHARGMLLTEAGEILARHARRTLLDSDRVLGEIDALRGLKAGRVRLATSDAFANELVPQLCAEFQRTHPGIRFHVQVLPTAQVPAAVRSGQADIGLCFSRAAHPDIAVAWRQRAPVFALLPVGHALARVRRLTLRRMAAFPLALPPPETTIRQLIDVACNRQNLQLDPVLVSGHAQTMLHFVASGGGLSVGSDIAARQGMASGQVLVRPLSDDGMDLRDIEVQTLAGRHLPVAVQAFLDRLCARLRQSAVAPARHTGRAGSTPIQPD